MPLDCVEARENFRKNELQTGNQSGRSDNNQGDDRHRPRLAAREPIQLKRATQGTDGHHESAQQPANDFDFLEHFSKLPCSGCWATGVGCIAWLDLHKLFPSVSTPLYVIR